MSANDGFRFELTVPQSKILMSRKRNRVVNAGRRFGKTYLSGAVALDEGTSEYATKRGDFVIWYLAPVADQARSIMWDGWLMKYVPKEWISYLNRQRMQMVLANGTSINVFSADNPDHLVGSGIDLLIMDECALMDKDVYEKIRPALSDKHHLGKALFISTPRGFNWFHDLWLRDITNPESWESFQFTTLDGGNVSEEEIEQARRDMSPKMFAQEYLASFESLANRIYYAYDEKQNLADFNPAWMLGDIHVGIDFNVSPMTATISHVDFKPGFGSISYTFDEFYENNSDTDYLAKWLKDKYPHSMIYAYPDPTGKRKQTSSIGKSDFSILESYGIRVLAPYAPYSSKDKFNTANAAFCNAAGEHRNYIARGACPHLRTGLKGYAYREDGRPDKSGGYDHITDAHAYFLNYVFPFYENNRVYRPEVQGV